MRRSASVLITGLVVTCLAIGLTPGVSPAQTLKAFSEGGGGAPATAGAANSEATPAAGTAKAADAYGKLPTSFAINRGQAPPDVRFMAGGKGYSLALTATEAVLTLTPPTAAPTSDEPPRLHAADPAGPSGRVVRMRLAGANPHPTIEGLDQLPGVANYLTGSDPKDWHTNLATYAKVAYRGVYPGIDLVWYGHDGSLEHDFVVAPGADPDQIEVVFDGAEQLTIDGDHVEITLPGGGTLTERIPAIYQTIDGKRHPVTGHFEALGADRVGFGVGSYDTGKALVIDPVLEYSTYLGSTGGGGNDVGLGIAIDGAGNAYVAGSTSSVDFPTTAGAVDEAPGAGGSGGVDGFVTKLNPAGTALVYSTYLGGTGGEERATGIAVDGNGAAYVTGRTDSVDFPTTAGAFDEAPGPGGGDAFVTKLNPTGTGLDYSTYLGGTGSDEGNGIAVDGAGHAYVTGRTDSVDFPTTAGAFDETESGVGDAFVTKLNPTGTALAYSTYLGGTGDDVGFGIAVDGAGHALVTGRTDSVDFSTTPGAFDEAPGPGDVDVFVTKLNPAGTALVYSTYLGGTGFDQSLGIALDGGGNAYVTGDTDSADFPTTAGAFDEAPGPGAIDAFVTKLNPTGTALVYSTYLGGTLGDGGDGIAVDAAGSAYIIGFTRSADFPTTAGAFDEAPGPGAIDAFVTKLNPTGTALAYSTYLAGTDFDEGRGIAVDGAGSAYVTGFAGSRDFPVTAGGFDEIEGGGGDAFVTKLNPTGRALVYSTYLGGRAGVDEGHGIAVDRGGNAYITGGTFALDFPTTAGAFDEAPGPNGDDVFVAKLNPTGTALVYSTYLGGTAGDVGFGIAVDGAGSAYVTGLTRSSDFPVTAGAFDETESGVGDAFVTKLNPTGTALDYSTYLGGTGDDVGFGIAVDGAASAYVTGFTGSTDFSTTPGAFDEAPGPGVGDAFVTKLNPTGTALVYSTYLGGTGDDVGFGIALDPAGNAYVTGTTDSVDFPTTAGAFDEAPGPGGGDAFVTKLNPPGTALDYSTYLGGTGSDQGSGIAVDPAGSAYVTGTTDSVDFPTTAGAFDLAPSGDTDVFVTKLNPTGTTLAYSTYLGGTSFDDGNGIALDAAGSAYVTGSTGSTDFPTTPDAIQATNAGGLSDVFVTKLNPTGTTLAYSTYLGGTSFDEGSGIAVDGAGNAYVTGETFSTDFPTTPGAFQTANPGTSTAADAFVTKIGGFPSPGPGDGDDDDDDDGDDDDGDDDDDPKPKRSGRITIVEDIRTDRDVTFGFHTKSLKARTFRLGDDGKRTFKNLKAGTYTVAQDRKAGWRLDKIVCKDPTKNTKVVLDTRRAVIKLKAGEHVTCTFTNKKK